MRLRSCLALSCSPRTPGFSRNTEIYCDCPWDTCGRDWGPRGGSCSIRGVFYGYGGGCEEGAASLTVYLELNKGAGLSDSRRRMEGFPAARGARSRCAWVLQIFCGTARARREGSAERIAGRESEMETDVCCRYGGVGKAPAWL